MLSWLNWKCLVDWKGYDKKLSRQIWSTMLIRRDDSGWCHDQIWDALWIGTYETECCHDLTCRFMCIRIFNEKFEVLCSLEHMIDDDGMT
jgi:hypothetical protein